jgi:2-methylisocitrate lyase-like PEP mutase family enzyme
LVEHVATLAASTDLPISVDLENGYGAAPEHAARAIEAVAAVGAVGGSIEDWDPTGRLYEREHAAERVAAAVEAARGLGFRFTLTARAENHIRGNPDLADTIERLQAFELAGADVLYAPGLRTAEEVQSVCEAVSKPVNVLALPELTLAEVVEAGAKRISVGGGLTWIAVSAMASAAVEIRDAGDFSALAARLPLDEWLGRSA